MKKEIIGIIGLGYWGTIVTNALIGLKIFKNIYIYDRDLNKIALIKKKFKSKVSSISFNEILKKKDIKNIFNFFIFCNFIKSNRINFIFKFIFYIVYFFGVTIKDIYFFKNF